MTKRTFRRRFTGEHCYAKEWPLNIKVEKFKNAWNEHATHNERRRILTCTYASDCDIEHDTKLYSRASQVNVMTMKECIPPAMHPRSRLKNTVIHETPDESSNPHRATSRAEPVHLKRSTKYPKAGTGQAFQHSILI